MKLFRSLILMIALGFSQIFASANSNHVTKLTVNTEESRVEWIGKKVTGAHNGYVSIQSGELNFDVNHQFAGGRIVIDMTTISVEDIENPKYNKKLVDHLNSDDFFGVEEHPTASLVLTNVERNGNEFNLTADFTIKGVTKSFTFPIAPKIENGKFIVDTEIDIDRTEFDIKFGSGTFFKSLGDKAINDKFKLKIHLVAK